MDYTTMLTTSLLCAGLAICAFVITAREFARMKRRKAWIPQRPGSRRTYLR